MTSSPSFRRELPTSKVAGGISMGLNSLRSESTLSFMLSHLTLRMQARMKQYAIRPLSLLSASGQINILREIVTFSLAFIPYLAKGKFPLANVKTGMNKSFCMNLKLKLNTGRWKSPVVFLLYCLCCCDPTTSQVFRNIAVNAMFACGKQRRSENLSRRVKAYLDPCHSTNP